jgi:phenylalanyl-tRNA synthetase beta chain
MNRPFGALEYNFKKKNLYFCRVDAQKAATLLNRMSLRAQVIDSDTLRVNIPVTRADILHFCDIAEDCAVAYGFNNIVKTVPKTSCIGNQVREEHKNKTKIFVN